jgi:putative restriction endonuclease
VLLILARAQQRGDNCFHFKDVVDQLETGLRDYGLVTKRLHPEYPFWHLANDGFWIIENQEAIAAEQRSQSPTKKVLLDNDAVGHVPDELWDQLLDDPALTQRLIDSVLSRFWPDTCVQSQVAKHTGVTRGS